MTSEPVSHFLLARTAATWRQRVGRWSLILSAVWGTVHGLAGCAAPQAPTAGEGEMITASDEPEYARRARIRLELAIGYFQRGQMEFALDEVKRSLTAYPGYSKAYNVRGLIYNQLHDQRMAEESFRRAVALNPRDGDAQHNLGWLLCENGRTAEGMGYLDQALANPYYENKERTRVAKGRCDLKAGDRGDAENALLDVLQSNPQDAQASAGLADLYYQRGDYRKSAMYANQANRPGTATAASLWTGIRAEQHLGHPDGVARYGQQLQDSFPNSHESQLYQRGAWDE